MKTFTLKKILLLENKTKASPRKNEGSFQKEWFYDNKMKDWMSDFNPTVVQTNTRKLKM